MKRIFFAFVFILCWGNVFSQGNLQFNQVILYDVASAGIQAMTVPLGKVWKIESVGGTSSTMFYLRNSSAQTIATLGYGGTPPMSALPFWLPSSFNGSIQNATANRCSISIIEFNVIP